MHEFSTHTKSLPQHVCDTFGNSRSGMKRSVTIETIVDIK